MFRKILFLVSSVLLVSSCKHGFHSKKQEEQNKVVVINYKNIFLPKAMKVVLDEQIELLKQKPTINVELAGYCALDASKRFNLDIATKRAEATRSYLIRNGISATRIKVIVGHDGKDLQFADKCIVVIAKN